MGRNTVGKKTKVCLQAAGIPVLSTEKVTFGERSEGSRETSVRIAEEESPRRGPSKYKAVRQGHGASPACGKQ